MPTEEPRLAGLTKHGKPSSPSPRGVGRESDLETVRRDGREVALRPLEHLEALGPGLPASLLADCHRHHLVALGIEVRDDRRCRTERHLVLARASPVHHRHPQPFHHASAWHSGPCFTRMAAGGAALMTSAYLIALRVVPRPKSPLAA